MDFGAYLAASSSEDGDDEGEGPSGCGPETASNEEDKIQKYKVQANISCEISLLL